MNLLFLNPHPFPKDLKGNELFIKSSPISTGVTAGGEVLGRQVSVHLPHGLDADTICGGFHTAECLK